MKRALVVGIGMLGILAAGTVQAAPVGEAHRVTLEPTASLRPRRRLIARQSRRRRLSSPGPSLPVGDLAQTKCNQETRLLTPASDRNIANPAAAGASWPTAATAPPVSDASETGRDVGYRPH
jgi:hypothetical protein